MGTSDYQTTFYKNMYFFSSLCGAYAFSPLQCIWQKISKESAFFSFKLHLFHLVMLYSLSESILACLACFSADFSSFFFCLFSIIWVLFQFSTFLFSPPFFCCPKLFVWPSPFLLLLLRFFLLSELL